MNSWEIFTEPLTVREQDVMACLMRAFSTIQTAAALGMSINTVKFHRRNIYSKLGVSNRRVAVEAYVRALPVMAPSDNKAGCTSA